MTWVKQAVADQNPELQAKAISFPKWYTTDEAYIAAIKQHHLESSRLITLMDQTLTSRQHQKAKDTHKSAAGMQKQKEAWVQPFAAECPPHNDKTRGKQMHCIRCITSQPNMSEC